MATAYSRVADAPMMRIIAPEPSVRRKGSVISLQSIEKTKQMTMAQSIVCGSGILLFVLGLLNGLIIPKTTSPRLSLSAHLTAVQSGTFLIAIAWAWPHFEMAASTSLLLAYGLSGSLYILWLGFLMAGIWGAGRNLAIAGQNSETSPLRQAIVTACIGLGVLGTIVTTAFLLFRWPGLL